MCGIAGFFADPGNAASRAVLLSRMIGTLGHRGPDAQEIKIAGDAGLAHARLSIIDIAAGRQPMTSDDGAVTITFNGEIFNYVELRDKLIARGYRFRTGSDTEVILRLYEDRGADCVSALNGDFAFAIWDARKQEVLLARDRMGVRPLFFTERNGGFYFASEIKALLSVPGVEAEADPIALDQIFTFWFPLAPRTAFKNIFELPPAHLMIVSARGRTTRPYWRLTYPRVGEEDRIDAGEAAISAELTALLTDATRIRLRSDVPVGAYLSGGLDSSIVTALAGQVARERLRTFSVGFETEEFDESAFQQQMVAALGTDHTSMVCRTADIGAMFPDVIRHVERPILRTAPAPLFALSRLVHESGFKVVLTGEGADEVFAGYDIFKEAKLRRFCASQPESRRRPLLLQRLYPYLPNLRAQSQRYREAFFAAGAGELADPLFSHLPRFRTTAGAKAFFSSDLQNAIGDYDALADLRDRLPPEFARWHPLSQAQYLEAAHLLPSYILSSQGDRVAMAHAVEGRFPFLDHRVVEFASRIPPHLKLRTLREKHILRRSMAHLLPPQINNRPKQPYRAPDSQSFVGAAAPAYVQDCMSLQAIAAGGLFDPNAVGKLVRKCAAQPLLGFRDNMAFVGILSTELWRRHFSGRTPSSRAAASPLAA